MIWSTAATARSTLSMIALTLVTISSASSSRSAMRAGMDSMYRATRSSHATKRDAASTTDDGPGNLGWISAIC